LDAAFDLEQKAKGARQMSLENVRVGDVLRVFWTPWQREPKFQTVLRLTAKHVVTLVVMKDGRKIEHLWRKDNGDIRGDYGGFTKPYAEPMEDTDNE
jgi:tRNA pseudouridine-54 N-methylase